MDDDFDYGELSLRTTTAYAVKADVQFISGTILLIFGIVGSFLVYAMLIYRRKKISIGVRYYAFFIVTCNLIYLVNRIGNYSSFPFMNMMPAEVSRIFRDFNPMITQWFNIVYCWLTTILFFETIVRSRLNGPGFSHIAWIIICCLFTVVIGVYMVLKFTILKYNKLDPEPHTIVHLVGYVLLLLSALGMLFSGLILICSRQKINDENGYFCVSAFLGILIYGMITVWWQFPSGYEISQSLLESKVTTEMMVDILNKLGALVTIFTVSKDYANLSISAILTWGMLIFLPGMSIFGVGNKKNGSSNRIGDSSEKQLTSP